MSEKTRKTQNEMILDYIAEFGSITPLDAVRDLGCMRLASRISDLKRQGYPIQSKFEPFTKRNGEKGRYKRYSLQGGDV